VARSRTGALPENIAGETFAVDSHQHRLFVNDRLAFRVKIANPAFAKRQMRLSIHHALIRMKLKSPTASADGQFRFAERTAPA